VTFTEQGKTLSELSQGDDVQWLTDAELVEILDELPHRPLMAGKDRVETLFSRSAGQVTSYF
jgi:serine/threonine-protein kinase HipA